MADRKPPVIDNGVPRLSALFARCRCTCQLYLNVSLAAMQLNEPATKINTNSVSHSCCFAMLLRVFLLSPRQESGPGIKLKDVPPFRFCSILVKLALCHTPLNVPLEWLHVSTCTMGWYSSVGGQHLSIIPLCFTHKQTFCKPWPAGLILGKYSRPLANCHVQLYVTIRSGEIYDACREFLPWDWLVGI